VDAGAGLRAAGGGRGAWGEGGAGGVWGGAVLRHGHCGPARIGAID